MIRDLTDIAVKLSREKAMETVKHAAIDAAEERILDALLPAARGDSPESHSDTRQKFRKMLREGKLDDKEVEIEVNEARIGVEIMAPPGMEEMTNQLQSMFQNMGTGRTRVRKMKVREANKLISEEEADALINEEDMKAAAIEKVEQNGIVFLDEIDKIAQRSEHGGADVSREGVQRDLLPLVEGSTVTTKYGMVRTDHILFIASGAFHLSKPSDLVPELQGRLPIRVELSSLDVNDFVRILTEPDASLTSQYAALMLTEGMTLKFATDAIQRIAEIAWEVNERTENIGARRLQTVMEHLLEKLSFEASDSQQSTVNINAAYVDEHLNELAQNEDLAQYIL